jgi:ABC-type antimicrobial peptide transport system permease subunit
MAFRQELWVRAVTDNFRLAFSTFWGHRLRSMLTLLGIVIGAATVVAMMALLEGLRNKVDEDLTGLGSNGFQIQKFPTVSAISISTACPSAPTSPSRTGTTSSAGSTSSLPPARPGTSG